MATAVLRKWGSGAGIYVPKDVIDMLGLSVGHEAECKVDVASSTVTYNFAPSRSYSRKRKLTMTDLEKSWSGERIGGSEIIKGSVGSEVLQ